MFEGFEERRVAVGEAELYLRLGGDGPPLLLLHGFPQTHVIWHRVAPLLARDFTLVIPDLRGYGASRVVNGDSLLLSTDNSKLSPLTPAPDPEHHNYSKRAMAADMVALMAALGHERFALAGHDRGGRVGYRLCLDYPERVTRFAALDIVPTLDVWEAMDGEGAIGAYHWPFLAVPAPVPERLIGSDPDFYYSHLLERWAGRPDALDPEAVRAYLAQFHDPAVIAATCADYRAGATVDRAHDQADRDAGRKLDCPVLVVWGRRYLTAKDPSPLLTWQNWADDTREVALDCGHFVAEEEPEACAAALRDFLLET